MTSRDPVLACLPVIDALEALGVPYYIGGSVASTHFGVARSTVDVDVIALMEDSQVEPLVELLQETHYIDAGMIIEAIDQRSSFNVIHLATMTKIDVFVPGRTPDQEVVLKRARRDDVFAPESDREVFVASPEDIVLSKIKWFKMTGERSEKQWTDVRGVLQSQAEHLDRGYMEACAQRDGISELLSRSIQEANI